MGFIEDASTLGVSAAASAGRLAAKGAKVLGDVVSIVAVEHFDFVKKFTRLCDDGWHQGWHERNGGNLTYRLTEEDVAQAQAFFNAENSEWTHMGVTDKELAGAYFLTTGSGRYMRNARSAPSHTCGIVEINEEGSAYRIVWGLAAGGKPTSEFPTHFMAHGTRMRATGGADRVIYHAHPDNVIAMTFVLPLDAKTITRKLWQAMTECVVVFPAGVGVVPWMVPGGAEIARATSNLMEKYSAAIWAQHGLFCAGATFDETFGLMHTIEKAAKIYNMSRATNGGSDAFLNTITDSGLLDIEREFGLQINREFLEDAVGASSGAAGNSSTAVGGSSYNTAAGGYDASSSTGSISTEGNTIGAPSGAHARA